MPTYEYECPECGDIFERPLVRPEDRDDEVMCECEDPMPYMKRIPSTISSYIGSKDRPSRGQG